MKLLVAVLAVALVTLVGCGADGAPEPAPSSAPPSPGPTLTQAALLAARHGLHPQGRSACFVDVVPEDPTASAEWGLIQVACADSGYDLVPFRGEQATFASYLLAERLHGSPTTLWTIERDGRIIGAYVAAEDATPGILSLKQAEGLRW